jgi:PIN domain nuclease of toxin-antitoxin system
LKLLLDTHVWLWSLLEPARLTRRVRSAVTRPQNELWASPISVWELLVLAERGRVKLDGVPRQWVTEALARRWQDLVNRPDGERAGSGFAPDQPGNSSRS